MLFSLTGDFVIIYVTHCNNFSLKSKFYRIQFGETQIFWLIQYSYSYMKRHSAGLFLNLFVNSKLDKTKREQRKNILFVPVSYYNLEIWTEATF